MKGSIISLSFGRMDLTKRTFDHNLSHAGCDYELLLCDQGHYGAKKEEGFEEYLESLSPVYFRKNIFNEGVSRSLNQLMLRCSTDFIFFMPNDILLPKDFLKLLIEHAEDIENSGIVGFSGQDLQLPERVIRGKSGRRYSVFLELEFILDQCQVYGATLVTRKCLETIGYYHEGYHPYAFEDADYCFRAHLSGLKVYHLPQRGEHIGGDHGEDTPYKQFKLGAYYSNAGLHRYRIQNYNLLGLYEAAPRIKGPLI